MTSTTTTCRTCGLTVSTRGGPYCAEHKREASLEYARLKEARYRARKKHARLKRMIASKEDGEIKDAPALSLGTSNLHGNPVRRKDGTIDFKEEERRVRAELRRMRLRNQRRRPR